MLRFFREVGNVYLVILEEQEALDLWIVEDNGESSFVVSREKHLERVSVRRKSCDCVYRVKC